MTHFKTRDRDPLPSALIVRTTGEGIRIRARFPRASAETFNGRDYRRGALYQSATIPVLAIIDVGGGGGPGIPTTNQVVVHVKQGIAKVEARFGYGFTDAMKPIQGWAVLAAYGGATTPITVRGLDASNRALATTSADAIHSTPCSPTPR